MTLSSTRKDKDSARLILWIELSCDEIKAPSAHSPLFRRSCLSALSSDQCAFHSPLGRDELDFVVAIGLSARISSTCLWKKTRKTTHVQLLYKLQVKLRLCWIGVEVSSLTSRPFPNSLPPQTAFDNFKTSVNASLKSTSDYFDNLKKNIATHDADFNQNASEFFKTTFDNANYALHELKENTEKLPGQVDAANKQHLEDVKVSLAKLGDQVDQLKTQAGNYDAKFNSDLPGQVEEANQDHLEEVKASLAKLKDQLEHLKTQAADYDHKFNSNVAHFFSQQKQHIHDHLQHAKEHLNAVFRHHSSA
ncbi:unnamed protein product [Aphanomyces euteiches]